MCSVLLYYFVIPNKRRDLYYCYTVGLFGSCFCAPFCGRTYIGIIHVSFEKQICQELLPLLYRSVGHICMYHKHSSVLAILYGTALLRAAAWYTQRHSHAALAQTQRAIHPGRCRPDYGILFIYRRHSQRICNIVQSNTNPLSKKDKGFCLWFALIL